MREAPRRRQNACALLHFLLVLPDKKLLLGLSDERPYRNLKFHNVLARQDSSYCNRARLNFQAFALRDMKIATRGGCRVGQKVSYHLSFS